MGVLTQTKSLFVNTADEPIGLYREITCSPSPSTSKRL